MAGIGFELRKLFVGRGAIARVRAYAYASVVCAGTMILAVVMLLFVQQAAKAAGVGEHERETLVVMIVYATLLSMLLASALQTFLSRYVADMLYQNAPERVLPSLIGGAVALMVPGGVFYALLLASAGDIPVLDRALNWILFMELIPVWLQMAYITAAKDYRRILAVFALGVGASLVLGVGLNVLGVSARTAFLAALAVGYALMLTGFTGVLLRYFPSGKGSPFAFIAHFAQTPDLIPTGALGMTGAFAHIFIMWFSPLGESVTGAFRQAATHDAAAFFAYLASLPTLVGFVVSVEVNFYQKYRRYFGAITGGGTLSEISMARQGMVIALKQEIAKLTQVQALFVVGYVVLMRYFLQSIGFTVEMIAMFQVMSVGYAAYALGNSLMLLQLYFNDRRGALLTVCVFFCVNTALSLVISRGPSLYYGVGLAVAGIAMYFAALPRLLLYVRRIDYHVFCGQPVLAPIKTSAFARMARRLDRKAERGASAPEKEGIKA